MLILSVILWCGACAYFGIMLDIINQRQIEIQKELKDLVDKGNSLN